MYCGYITTITKLREHTNADRLLCAEVFGNNVIVSKDYYEGQKVVYFPIDGKLGKEYAEEHNLVRKKDENGNNIGGYLDPDKRNITAVKLRGEKSEGLIMPIESLSKYTDVTLLKNGDQITTLDGVVICEKYIPRSNRRHGSGYAGGSNGKRNDIKAQYPLFKEHIDTAQLAYNMNAFRPGDTVYLTLKMHGCFKNSTRVNLWNKPKAKRIREIKKGDIVIGYKDGQFVPSKVLDTYINGKRSEWVELLISREGFSGEKNQKIECTPDHLFWDYKTNNYIPAKELKEGQSIGLIKNTLKLTAFQKQALIGMYLGDSYYCSRNKVSKLEFGYKKEHEDYIDYICEIMPNLVIKDSRYYLSGYGTEMARAKTKECISIKNFFDEFLENGENKINEKIIEYFSPISLAFLYMDDGSLLHNDTQRDRANIAICDYNDHDALIIQKCLEKLGIHSTLYKDPKGYNRLRVLTDDSENMFRLITPYIPEIMRYKLPKEFRNIELEDISTISEFGYEFIDSVVNSVKFINGKRWNAHDLHTETNNYVVGNVLVHNSSGRTQNSLTDVPKPQSLIQRLFKQKPQMIKTWVPITGTRRVVLNNFEDESGYYGTNAFRKQYHDFFKEKLPKGFEVFYEIVGYIDGTSTPIMSKCNNKLIKDKDFTKKYGQETVFSYGCNGGMSDCYVYRMTHTNEDGFITEIPWEVVKILCDKWGVKHVPELDKFLFTTQEELMERVNKWLDIEDPIGKTHVAEGVVVRIDNRESFTAYKHKGWYFKVLEGIMKDTADEPDMEEAQELINEGS